MKYAFAGAVEELSQVHLSLPQGYLMAGQQTNKDDHSLSGQTFALPVILIGHVNKQPEKIQVSCCL